MFFFFLYRNLISFRYFPNTSFENHFGLGSIMEEGVWFHYEYHGFIIKVLNILWRSLVLLLENGDSEAQGKPKKHNGRLGLGGPFICWQWWSKTWVWSKQREGWVCSRCSITPPWNSSMAPLDVVAFLSQSLRPCNAQYAFLKIRLRQ